MLALRTSTTKRLLHPLPSLSASLRSARCGRSSTFIPSSSFLSSSFCRCPSAAPLLPSSSSAVLSRFSVWSHLSGSLEASPLDFSSIPVIDLQPFLSSSSSSPTSSSLAAFSSSISSLHSACQNVGFFYVKNHSIPSSLISSALHQSRAFFSLPLPLKLEAACKESPNRGYFTFGDENLGDKEEGDYKEGMDIGVEVEGKALLDPSMQKNNLWPSPSILPHFRAVMEEYFAAMMKLSRQLTEAIALSLNIPHDRFEVITRHPMASLRLTHYPPQAASSVSDSCIGAGAHSDYGLLTIVAENREGLEVRNRKGEWVRCPHIDDNHLIVNLGDMMQRMTGGVYRSTPHRVINKVDEDVDDDDERHHRYSLPFFYEPDIDGMIELIPEMKGRDGCHFYEPIVFGDHLKDMYELTYKKKMQTQ